MTTPAKAGPPIFGIVFLALGLFKFLEGEAWVVWIILAVLFGGLTIFNSNRPEGAE